LDSVVQLYQEIEHTADRSFHVGGRTLAELFTNAALALTAVQAATVVEGSRTAREVEVTGVDRETLLVNWLNEILYLQEKHREIYARFAFLAISERYLHARMEGSPLVTARTLVKAVTLPTCGAIMNAQ
jgi:SHS2 domain-containing protein